jgi:arginyl-tRNA synthetase
MDMYDYKETWKTHIAGALAALMQEYKLEGTIDPSQVTAEIPPNPALGDLGFPMFGFAKLLKKGPPQIAQLVCSRLSGAFDPAQSAADGSFAAEGPYVNIRLNRGAAAAAVLAGGFSVKSPLAGSRIMVEFSSPNTNKPLHLGHLRNDALGESISRILAACGAEVRKVCIINDRGIHICKSMLAYKEYGQGRTPESEGVKSDRFVGDWYVCFNKHLQEETEELVKTRGLKKEEAETQAPLMLRAQEMLRNWEAGDSGTVALWKKMNDWTIRGMKETYERTGVSFDQYYFESQTYLLGRDEILKGLERGVFRREEDGSVQVDLTAEHLDKKVLLRRDGTSIYITQDIGLAISRSRDWPFDRLIYVVGSEQQYHFKALFSILDKLGFAWAGNLYHLSYGMVNLPEGRMKSREGTVVDADDLIDSLRDMALREIQDKNREAAVGDPGATAEKIALGALHYYLLSASPSKDMLFNPRESLAFNGNTGPYLQYMGARISSILREAAAGPAVRGTVRPELLSSDAEWELIKTISSCGETVADAAARMDPSLLTAYLYELSKTFSRFYHDCPILKAEPDLAASRLALCRSALGVLRKTLELTCIPFLEAM